MIPLDDPFVCVLEKPLPLGATPLCPFEEPAVCDGPASEAESRETDKAESLSLSVSLMLRSTARA